MYFFQIKYTEAFCQSALGNCYGLKWPKCWLQFEKKNCIASFSAHFRSLYTFILCRVCVLLANLSCLLSQLLVCVSVDHIWALFHRLTTLQHPLTVLNPGLKSSFSTNPSHHSLLFFFFWTDSTDSPDCLLVLFFAVFVFYFFLICTL